MKACYQWVAVLFAVATAGCAAGRRHDMDQLERELRYLEDKVFQLEFANQECNQQLQSAQRENEALLRDGTAKPGTSTKKGAQRGADKARGGATDEGSPSAPVVELPSDDAAPAFEGPPE